MQQSLLLLSLLFLQDACPEMDPGIPGKVFKHGKVVFQGFSGISLTLMEMPPEVTDPGADGRGSHIFRIERQLFTGILKQKIKILEGVAAQGIQARRFDFFPSLFKTTVEQIVENGFDLLPVIAQPAFFIRFVFQLNPKQKGP